MLNETFVIKFTFFKTQGHGFNSSGDFKMSIIPSTEVEKI